MEPNDETAVSATAGSSAVQAQRRFGVARQLSAVMAMRPRHLITLVVQAYNDWSGDGATRLGAALAYYTLFSIAPVLIVITGVAGFFIGRAAAREAVSPWLQRFLSAEGAQAAELMLKQHVTPTGGIITTLAGLVALFLATSAFVNELRQSLNLVWRVQTPASADAGIVAALRATFTDRLYAFALALCAGVLILLSLGANAAITVAGHYLHAELPLPAVALHAINFLVSFLVLSALFTLVYKMLPDAYVAWGDAWIGSVLTALLFDVGSLLVSMLVTTAGDSPYGTAASVLALLAWVYYSAQVFFFGAEITRIFATTHGGGIVATHRSLRVPRWRPGAGPASPLDAPIRGQHDTPPGHPRHA